MSNTLLQHSPAAERNQGPILAQLLALLAPTGAALEIASGTGQHAAPFAAALFVIHTIDNIFHFFDDLLRHDAVFFVELGLFFAAAFGFADGGFHAVGDFVGV